MENRLVAAVDWVVEFAQKVARNFSRLLWRLAFTYIVITVVTFMLLLGGLIYFTNRLAISRQTGSAMALAILDASSDLVPAFSQQPPDRAAVDAWVHRALLGTNLTFSKQNVPSEDAIPYTIISGKNTLLLVVDRDKTVVSTNRDSLTPTGLRMGKGVSTAGHELVDRALAGETNPILLFRRENGGLLVAAPVLDLRSGEVLGAVLVQLPRIEVLELLLFVTTATLSSGLFIAIAAAVIGMVFGLLVARGIEKRLKAVSLAVSAWGQGNFTPRIADKSADEIGLLAQDMNRMAAHLELLVQTRQELAALEERNRLARDLHDSVKQQVFATTMNLGAAQVLWDQNQAESRRRLEIAASLSRQSQQELTQLIQTLRPPNLQEKGLEEVLREHIAIWERNNGIAVQVQFPEAMPPLNLETQEVLYRVSQEAFSNIARHSKATAARLAIQRQSDRLAMLISDNGRGFDIAKTGCGMGLRSMPERVQKLGGTFDIESSNTGTHLRIQVPLKKEDDHGTDRNANHRSAGG